MQPSQSRPPVPRCVMWAIAWELIKQKDVIAALAVVTLFETYLRPSELLSLRGFQIFRPIPSSEVAQQATGGQVFLRAQALTPLETNVAKARVRAGVVAPPEMIISRVGPVAAGAITRIGLIATTAADIGMMTTGAAWIAVRAGIGKAAGTGATNACLPSRISQS